jgi:imidazole glycerol-phosphate synthase subunit HisH
MISVRVAIIDYGVGNILNIKRAFNALSISAEITSSPKYIADATHILLPGVGAFGAGLEGLDKHNLNDTIQNESKKGKPILGICLGMQLLLNKSYEFGEWQGLGLIPGDVVPLKSSTDNPVKIPQVGWNSIHTESSNDSFILKNSDQNEDNFYYFNHSFQVQTQKEYCVSTCSYGSNTFAAIIQKDNVIGYQFHPELSGDDGLSLLNRFIKYLA